MDVRVGKGTAYNGGEVCCHHTAHEVISGVTNIKVTAERTLVPIFIGLLVCARARKRERIAMARAKLPLSGVEWPWIGCIGPRRSRGYPEIDLGKGRCNLQCMRTRSCLGPIYLQSISGGDRPRRLPIKNVAFGLQFALM